MAQHQTIRDIPLSTRRRNAMFMLALTALSAAAVWIGLDGWLAPSVIALFGLCGAAWYLLQRTETVVAPEVGAAQEKARAAKDQRARDADDRLMAGVYKIGFLLIWAAVFIASWIYCIITYGYLLGVGLGWLPSLIVATIVAFLWPVIAIVAAFLYWLT